MSKAQELSLNMIVVGSLALLVLLIIGGVMIFGGSDLMSGLTGMGPSTEEISQTTFLSQCRSKCNSLNLELQSYPNWYNNFTMSNVAVQVGNSWLLPVNPINILRFIKTFCCHSADLNGNGLIEATGSSGPEICSKAYAQSCTIDGVSPAVFCKKVLSYNTAYYTVYDFTITTAAVYTYTHTCSTPTP
jgi:hypothetical protein